MLIARLQPELSQEFLTSQTARSVLAGRLSVFVGAQCVFVCPCVCVLVGMRLGSWPCTQWWFQQVTQPPAHSACRNISMQQVVETERNAEAACCRRELKTSQTTQHM